ncbi:hypothetical protein AB0F46_18775 [Streptomyces sp. NPDC026665]|uniref:hypothetical protein n=1 Tax=Streptomyces sp. NPDC026665 TaxID=3154798 RepID=UPI0034048346
MAIGYAHTLYCDRPGCRNKVTVPDTRSAAHARKVAERRFGWHIDQGERCPNEPQRAAGAAPEAPHRTPKGVTP